MGGIGKSRLAIEVARRRVDAVPDVHLVELAALADESLLAAHVAESLGIPERVGGDGTDQLTIRLRDLELLLVLDNCEHLRRTVANLVGQLLASAPGLRILATSRASLGVPGEIDYAVPPLSLPTGDDGESVLASDAAALFLARARAVRPSLPNQSTDLAIVAAICRDLDGLPPPRRG